MQDMASSVIGNPHSSWGGPGGFAAADAEARLATLHFCNAPAGEYVVIFTSGATGGHFQVLHLINTISIIPVPYTASPILIIW